MRFTKMQGLGNDYIYVNGMEECVKEPEELAKQMSDRHFGIGADGLILIGESEKADVRMEMYNADGSVGMMCGNGIRCVAKYVYERGIVPRKYMTIETLSGVKEAFLLPDGCVRIQMGRPEIEKIGAEVLSGGNRYYMDYISMGNPHAVVYVEDLPSLNLEEAGRSLEIHRGDGRRVNVEFVHVVNRRTLEMRVWERGSGETLACGTGACAAAISAVARSLTEREVRIKLLGGELLVKWRDDGQVEMTGPAVTVFEGEILI